LTRYFVRQSLPWASLIGAIAGCNDENSPAASRTGETFPLDTSSVTSSNFTGPKGFGGDLSDTAPQILMGAEKAANESMVVTVATAAKGAQDMCTPTAQAAIDGVDYPAREITVPDLPEHINNREEDRLTEAHAEAHRVRIENIQPGQPNTSTSLMEAMLGAADNYPLFWQVQAPTKESVRELFSSLEMPCETCPHNGELFSLSTRVVPRVAGSVAQPLT